MKKVKLKQLRSIAVELPKETYSIVLMRNKLGNPIRMGKFTVNHYRRLKRLIKAGYIDAAIEYLSKRNCDVRIPMELTNHVKY